MMAKKNVKKDAPKKKRWILVAILVIVLTAAAVAGFYLLGNGEPVEDAPVPQGPKKEITADYAHPIPQDLEYDGTLTLKNEKNYKDFLVRSGSYSGAAEPLYYYDENGEEAGWYLYDENGWVYGWKGYDGTEHKLPKDEQFESTQVLMEGEPLLIGGDVKVHIIVYLKDGSPVACYRHFILSEAADMDVLLTALERSSLNAEKVSDTVALEVLDQAAIEEELGNTIAENLQTEYAGLMNQRFGAKG